MYILIHEKFQLSTPTPQLLHKESSFVCTYDNQPHIPKYTGWALVINNSKFMQIRHDKNDCKKISWLNIYGLVQYES